MTVTGSNCVDINLNESVQSLASLDRSSRSSYSQVNNPGSSLQHLNDGCDTVSIDHMIAPGTDGSENTVVDKHSHDGSKNDVHAIIKKTKQL